MILSSTTNTREASAKWFRGLLVVQEKIAGVTLVTKLRKVYVLVKADFNCHNRLIFWDRMMKLEENTD